MYTRLDEPELAADYRALLARGSVMRRLALDQHALWRRAIRERARADALAVRTWSREGSPASVWAVLRDWRLTRAEREQLARRQAWLRED